MLSWFRNWRNQGDNETIEEREAMASGTHIVVGLGNPGRNYAQTRHNLGFMVVDELARRSGESTARKRFQSELIEARHPGGKLVLVKPQTYMNRSGFAVREVVNWFRVPVAQMLIVLDDLDLPYGQIRLRPSGSAGGHNGLGSIIEQAGDRQVPRLRIGIGRGPKQAKAHVLSHFAPSEQEQLRSLVEAAAGTVELWLAEGITTAMNEVNARKSVLPEPEQESAPPV